MTTAASTRWENSTITSVSSKNGTASPLQSGQPSVPLPPGPQPRPDSLTRTIPPTTIRTKVARTVRSARRRNRRSSSLPAPPERRPSMASGYRLAALGLLGGVRRLGGARRRRGCRASARRCGRRGRRRSCAAGAARAASHSRVSPRQGSGPAGRPCEALSDGVDQRDDDAGREHEGPDRRSAGPGSGRCRDPFARCWTRRRCPRELVDVHGLALEPRQEHRDEGELGAGDDQSRTRASPSDSPIIRPVIFGNQ